MQHAELIFFAAELTYSIIGKVFLVFSAENISHGQNYGSVIKVPKIIFYFFFFFTMVRKTVKKLVKNEQ